MRQLNAIHYFLRESPPGDLRMKQWNDRSLDAYAFVNFSLNTEGKADGIKMKAISPLTDFSFDFHDLRFERK